MTPLPIQIRRATPNDAAALAAIMGDPAVLASLMQLPYPNEQAWTQRLTEMLAPGKTDLLLVAQCAGDDGVPRVVANAGLYPTGTALCRRHVMGMGIAVSPSAQRQGVGRALMSALCDYADRWAQVLRIELQVFAENRRAIALYESFGFCHEGRHVGYALRDGRYVDALSMARLHPDPPRWGVADGA